MVVPSSSSSPEQQTGEHSGATLMKPKQTNGATAPQSISPNIPERISNFAPTDTLLTKQTRHVPGNQGWIHINMPRTNRETDLKYLPESQITAKRHLKQKKQRPVAAADANVTYLSTKAGENTSEVLLQIFYPTEKNLTQLENFQCNQTEAIIMYWLNTTMMPIIF